MITHTEATLQCEVCGAGWKAGGEVLNLSPPFDYFNGVFLADKPPVCPECGEEDAWDIAKPQGLE